MPGSTRFPTRDQLGIARSVSPAAEDARTIAEWLVRAENPCIYSNKVGHEPEATEALVRLAELLAIPYMEDRSADRMNFPVDSPFYGTGPEPKDADVLLIFEHLSPYSPGRESPVGRCQDRLDLDRSRAVALQDDRVPCRSVDSGPARRASRTRFTTLPRAC